MGSKSCAQPVCLILIMSENQQGHGKQELCPASLFNFDYEREPAGTWEKSELCPYLNSQESKRIMSEIAEIWEFRFFFRSQPYHALPS